MSSVMGQGVGRDAEFIANSISARQPVSNSARTEKLTS
jgi:hypothetical protein